MKVIRKRGFPRGSEYVVIGALLAVYALAIFLTPDPEWVVWAGQMSVGVIDPGALPPASPMDTAASLHAASAVSGLGLVAVLVLVVAAFGLRPGRIPHPGDHAVAGSDPGGHAGGPRP